MLRPESASRVPGRRATGRRVVATTGAVAVCLALLAASGCNRLSFIKPNMERKGSTDVAEPVRLKSVKRDSNRIASQARVQSAQRYLQSGDTAAANKEIKEALKLDPNSAAAYTMLAVMAGQRGARGEEGGYYKKAVDVAPNDGDALNNYGVWLCANGRQAEALPWFDRALADPTYTSPAQALANAGTCADQIGQNDRADRDLRNAILVDPANSMALGTLAKRELRSGRAFEARAFSERRLAIPPVSEDALRTASQIEQALGDRAAAAKYVQRIRAEFPNSQGSGTGDDGKR